VGGLGVGLLLGSGVAVVRGVVVPDPEINCDSYEVLTPQTSIFIS